jgi:hypothetical protein
MKTKSRRSHFGILRRCIGKNWGMNAMLAQGEARPATDRELVLATTLPLAYS